MRQKLTDILNAKDIMTSTIHYGCISQQVSPGFLILRARISVWWGGDAGGRVCRLAYCPYSLLGRCFGRLATGAFALLCWLSLGSVCTSATILLIY